MTAVASLARPMFAAGFRKRSDVRLMVADRGSGSIAHALFAGLAAYLGAGDTLVINVSATVPAAVDSETEPLRLHFSSPVAGDIWTVEPRRPSGVGSMPWLDFPGGELRLSGGGVVRLLARAKGSRRLWFADTAGLGDVEAYLQRHGAPIRYAHEEVERPLAAYQTVYATQPGSAEMPSAGRPFTAELMTALVAKGVVFAPIVLHTGVASFETGEKPDAERYIVPESTARHVNMARSARRRVLAVGTSCARAVETVTDTSGVVHPGAGVTELIIGSRRGVRVIDSMISGWHDSGSSHLDLLAAVSGGALLEKCYAEAAEQGYLAHEFGDSLLVLGEPAGRR